MTSAAPRTLGVIPPHRVFSYDAEGVPQHGDYCPTDDYACACGLFYVMYVVVSDMQDGLQALARGGS